MTSLAWLKAGCMALLLLAADAVAEAVTVRARYQPNQADFQSVDPPTGICARWPTYCRTGLRTFSVDLPIEFSKHMTGWRTPPRDQYYIGTPPVARVVLIHDRTGERSEATFEFVGWGMAVEAQDADHHPMDMPNPEGNCLYGLTWFDRGTYQRGGFGSVSPGGCYTAGNLVMGGSSDTRTDNMSALVRIQTPNPHRMKHGMWRGTVSYTAGDGAQIDLGNGAVVSRGGLLDFNLELEVIHSFVVDFPPNSDKAVLQPDGGWDRYWRGGPVPRRLYTEVPFRLWSSGPFKVYIECQRNMGTLCGLIHRPTTHQVPFSVALTLPPEHTHLGAPVVGQVLPVGQANALEFDSNATTWDRRGSLKYEVSGSDVIDEMLANPGATYSGLVWIIFDAEL